MEPETCVSIEGCLLRMATRWRLVASWLVDLERKEAPRAWMRTEVSTVGACHLEAVAVAVVAAAAAAEECRAAAAEVEAVEVPWVVGSRRMG